MRDNLERVTIVLTKEQHLRFKEYARRYHGSVSQFVRLAGENEMDDNNNTEDLRFRPIAEKLEKTINLIQNINRRQQKIERGTDFVVGRIGSKVFKKINKEDGLNLDTLRMELCRSQNMDCGNNTMNPDFVITIYDCITFIKNGNNIDDQRGEIEWSEIIY